MNLDDLLNSRPGSLIRMSPLNQLGLYEQFSPGQALSSFGRSAQNGDYAQNCASQRAYGQQALNQSPVFAPPAPERDTVENLTSKLEQWTSRLEDRAIDLEKSGKEMGPLEYERWQRELEDQRAAISVLKSAQKRGVA